MKLSELRYGEHFKCRFEPYLNKNEKITDSKNPLGTIQKSKNAGDAYIFQYGSVFKMVRLVDCSDSPSLDNRLLAGQTNLFEVENILSNGQVDVELVFFRELKIFKDGLRINVTEDFVDEEKNGSAAKANFSKKTGEDLCNILSSQFVLGSSSNPYFLFMANPKKSAEEEDSFTLVNKEWHLAVKSSKLNDETVLFTIGIKNHFPRNYENQIYLAQGRIKFSYLTKETISKLNATEIQKNLSAGNSYIGKWDEYNAEIGKRLLENARKIGYAAVSGRIEYNGVHEIVVNYSFSNGKSCNFENISMDFDTIDIVRELPEYLKNPAMTYDEWIEDVDAKLEAESILGEKKSKEEKENDDEEKKWSNLKITEIGSDYLKLSVKSGVKGLPKRGDNGELFLVLSIAGDKIQVERRRRARLNIGNGKSAISNLGLILDGTQGHYSNIPSLSGSVKKMSMKVQKKVFEYDPTENQRNAVRIALNTSDIAVIQGPPGTGKTTVICAIIESLNEEFQKSNELAGKIFVSALQHDAVYNIASRLSINALPTVKFGRSSAEDELSLSKTQENIAEWSRNTARKIEENAPSVKQSLEFQNLYSMFLDYHKSPSTAMEIELLNGIKNLSERFTTPAILEKIDSILGEIEGNSSSENKEILKTLYALRTDEKSFADDGAARAMYLRILLENENSFVPDCLKKASEWKDGMNLDFLGDLENLRLNLIEENLPGVEYRRKKENSAISEIVKEVSERIEQYPFDPSEKKNLALAEFIYELNNNPDGITNTLLSYNPVFAATVQQSEGREISKKRKQLGLDSMEEGSKAYEYVIIDEAARVSPPDLLIPMSKGKHIILVGDQRQLPQQVDQEIERKMEAESASSEDVKYLNESTFERLFSQLGIDKKITLNKQYRMHPLLGNFVSKEFYEIHNEGFESPLEVSKFVHNLPLIRGKAAVWCELPNDTGQDSESLNKSRSRFRRGEAILAAKFLKSWLDFDSEKKMNFGIISFYSAQCNEIKNQLCSYGIYAKNKDGISEILEEYKYTAPDKNGEVRERLRIGTVDAFQGMEFDVVILCAVRSANDMKIKNAYKEHQRNEEEGLKKQQGLFGFLMSKNRLCVSMSRQKKALMVIGDQNLFTSQIAKVAVPELYDFYELCKNDADYGLVLDSKKLNFE